MDAQARIRTREKASPRTPALRPSYGPGTGRRRAGFALAIAANVVLTLLLLLVRDHTSPLSKGFAFMAVVIAATSLGGLGPGLVASFLGFGLFNFLFIPPYGSFTVGRLEDVVVLFVFLGLSLVISTLLARQAERAAAAELRESELEVLQTLNRELVTRPPGPETYEAALNLLVALFGFEAASLLVAADGTGTPREAVTVGAGRGTIHPSWDPARSRSPVRIPLSIGSRRLGLVVLVGDRAAPTEPESRVLRTFCDELALVLERDRLLALAEKAEVYRKMDGVRRSLLGAVSHELRTPLAAIKASATDLLARDAPDEAAYRRDVLETVNEEADRLDGLIANLLDMSRIEAGNLTAAVQASDLAEALRRCADRTERIWPDITFELSVDDDAAFVRADPVFLDRIITNLVENAAKASPQGAHVALEARRDDRRATVRVIDHGRGVPRDAREVIFRPFFELDAERSGLGQGLGLAICKGFLSAMDGDIWVEDTPGGGATFAFSLPVQA